MAAERRREAVAKAIDVAQVGGRLAHVLLEVVGARARAAAVGDHLDDSVSDVAEAVLSADGFIHNAHAVCREIGLVSFVNADRFALADVLRQEGEVGHDRRRRQCEAPP